MTTPSPIPDARQCIKCGRPVGAEESICELCNRAGMATPSASQYHGTVAAAIVLAVALLALAAGFSLRDIGPYSADVREVVATEPIGYAITYTVTNEGSRPGRAKCLLVALGDAGQRLRTANTVTPQIPGGDTKELIEPIRGLDDEPADVTVDCS